MPSQMPSASNRPSTVTRTTVFTDGPHSNFILLNLMEVIPNIRNFLTRGGRGSMSVSGDLNSTITVVAIEIDGLVAVTVTEIDAEQTGCVITQVVVILDFQLLVRVRR